MATDVDAVVDHSVQTAYSDPRRWAHLLDEIDPTLNGVAFMARNVVAHYRAEAAELPESTREDISLRWTDAIFETDQRRNQASLTVERPVRNRVQGCCRDHTLLSVAALRHRAVPARSRVGFATYFSTTWNHDHVIVEAWLDGRWRRFDPEIASPIPRLEDPTDIAHGPDSPFLTAAHVWLAHRAGSIDVSRFGVDEGFGIAGDWFVHGYVIAEVAHRFGDELLLWDTWGAKCRSLTEAPTDDILLVDEVSRLLVRADGGDLSAERELLSRYREDARLRPGRHIRSFSPNGNIDEVDLSARTTMPAE
jgi:Transglutaminase-like superfamily